METSAVIILILFCTGASFVQRVSGFGFGIFIMTALPYIMPSYAEATTLSGLLSAAQSTLVFYRLRHLVSLRRLLPILLTFIVVSFGAIQWVASVDDILLKHILGAILILASFYFLFIAPHIHIAPSLTMQISMGSLSGIMGGLFAMQGPPAVLYFLASEKSKEAYLAMTQAYFLFGNLLMTAFRSGNGFLTSSVALAWIYAIIGVWLGTFLGAKVFDKLSALTLKRVIYFYMAISGVVALIQ